MELSGRPTEEEFRSWAKQIDLKQPEDDQDFDLTIDHIRTEVFVDIICDPEVEAAGNRDYFLMWLYARVYNRFYKLSAEDCQQALGEYSLAIQRCRQVADAELSTWANRLEAIFQSGGQFLKDEWSGYFKEYFKKSADKIYG